VGHTVSRFFMVVIITVATVFPGFAAPYQPPPAVRESGHIAIVIPASAVRAKMTPLYRTLREGMRPSTRDFISTSLASLGTDSETTYDPLAADWRSAWHKADKLFSAVVAAADLGLQLADAISTSARANGYQAAPVPADTTTAWVPASGDQLSRQGYGLAVEITGITVALMPMDRKANPPLQFHISSRVKLIQTRNSQVLATRNIVYNQSPALPLKSWQTNNAAAFRQQMAPAIHELAEEIATNLLMTQQANPRTVDSDAIYETSIYGLRPVAPRMDECIVTDGVNIRSLQPTLAWEPFAAEAVTYDLRIWRVPDASGPLDEQEIYREVLVYKRDRLSGTSHDVEIPLTPDTTYLWSVRARTAVNGRVTVGEWSRYAMQPTSFLEIATFGLVNLIDGMGEPEFCRFRTPVR